jgi:hypothetical protein
VLNGHSVDRGCLDSLSFLMVGSSPARTFARTIIGKVEIAGLALTYLNFDRPLRSDARSRSDHGVFFCYIYFRYFFASEGEGGIERWKDEGPLCSQIAASSHRKFSQLSYNSLLNATQNMVVLFHINAIIDYSVNLFFLLKF